MESGGLLEASEEPVVGSAVLAGVGDPAVVHLAAELGVAQLGVALLQLGTKFAREAQERSPRRFRSLRRLGIQQPAAVIKMMQRINGVITIDRTIRIESPFQFGHCSGQVYVSSKQSEFLYQ